MKMVQLKDVAEIERQSLAPEAIQTGTRYVGLENIDGVLATITSETVSDGELASSKFQFCENHILYGKLRPYLKKIVCPDFTGICSTDILPIRPFNIDKRYLYHFLRQDEIVARINALTSGANLPRISPKRLEELEVPLPTLDEQKRIAAILDQADALRQTRRQSLQRLNQLGQSIFYEMFGDNDTWTEKWDFKNLTSICRPKQWKTISANELHDEGYPVYGANGIIGFYDQYNHKDETILITCRGATCGTINICQPRSYVTGNSMALNQLDSDWDLSFLEFTLRIRGLNDIISGSAQPQITRQGLESVQIPFPSPSLQKIYGLKVKELRVKAKDFEISCEKLEALFSSLQQRAFKGEL
jgi:type I restriction enzyme, S subunit